jgi:hypothetical protein
MISNNNQSYNDDVLWNLCDSYEKLTGSRAALNNYLTVIFRKCASMDQVLMELKSSIRNLKADS